MAEEERTLGVQDIGHVNAHSEIVGVAPHQLVCKEQPDERDPVAQEQPAAADEDCREAQGDQEHVGGDRDAPTDH